MSKTKAQLEAALAAAEKLAMDLRDEATGYHQEAKRLQDQLEAALQDNWRKVALEAIKQSCELQDRVDAMGENKPWKLLWLAFTAGLVIGWIAQWA